MSVNIAVRTLIISNNFYYNVMSYYAYLDLRREPCAGGPRMRTHCSFVLSVMYGCMDIWIGYENNNNIEATKSVRTTLTTR